MAVFRYEPHLCRVKHLACLPEIQASQPRQPHEYTPSDQEEQGLDFEVVVVALMDVRQFLPKALDVPRVKQDHGRRILDEGRIMHPERDNLVQEEWMEDGTGHVPVYQRFLFPRRKICPHLPQPNQTGKAATLQN